MSPSTELIYKGLRLFAAIAFVLVSIVAPLIVMVVIKRWKQKDKAEKDQDVV